MSAVSVICPLYNSLPHLAAMIDSLKAQTMSDFEVIVVDDHSTDGSLQKAQEHVGDDKRFRFMQTSVNSGPGVARNMGIDAAEGDYIAFIDSDDIYHPDFLMLLTKAAEGGKDIAYCQLEYKGGDSDGKVHRNPVVEDGCFSIESKKRFLKSFVTFSVCFIYRRDFLRRHKLYFPELSNSEDTNFLIKNILLAETVACVDKPLYYYVVHASSLTHKRNMRRPIERLASMRALMKEFKKMKHDKQLTSLHLNRYNGVMTFLWLKKGLLLGVIELLRNIIR